MFIPRDNFRQMLDFETCNFCNCRSALLLILRLNFEVIIVTFEFVIFSMFYTWTGVVLMNSSRSKKAHRSLDHRAKIKTGAICLASLQTFDIEISFLLYENDRVRETGFSGNCFNKSVHVSMIFLWLIISDVSELGSSKDWLNDIMKLSNISRTCVNI